jgi:hypothetical protein
MKLFTCFTAPILIRLTILVIEKKIMTFRRCKNFFIQILVLVNIPQFKIVRVYNVSRQHKPAIVGFGQASRLYPSLMINLFHVYNNSLPQNKPFPILFTSIEVPSTNGRSYLFQNNEWKLSNFYQTKFKFTLLGVQPCFLALKAVYSWLKQ